MAQRLGRGEAAVGRAEHAVEQRIPAWSGVISRRRSPETSTSMCSLIVRTVRGFAQILMTGSTGLPMTFPCPVGKKWTT